MRQPLAGTTALLLACLAGCPVAIAAEQPAGAWTLDLRLRHEAVREQGFRRAAVATTLRSRLGVEGPLVWGVRGGLGIEDTRRLGPPRFNSGGGSSPGRSRYPVVADPHNTEIDTAWLALGADPAEQGVGLRIGRQVLSVADQRFVGAVGWRQNRQTFDAVALGGRLAGVQADLVLLHRANRVFGADAPAGQHDLRGSGYLALRWPLGAWTLEALALQVENRDVAAASTRTLTGSLAWQQQRPWGHLALRGAIGRQREHADNPRRVRAWYRRLTATVGGDGATVLLGWERLGGAADPAEAPFGTPLATLHAFNGWADVFLATPQRGLDDVWLQAGWRRGPWRLAARQHQFSTATGGGRLGRETDLHLGWQQPRWQLDLHAAHFKAASAAAPRDTSKLWLTLGVRLGG